MRFTKQDLATVMTAIRPAPPGFVESPAGRRALAAVLGSEVQAPAHRWRKRVLLLLIGLGVIVIGGTGTAIATYQAPVAPPDQAYVSDGRSIVCAKSDGSGGGDNNVRKGESPFDTCRRVWPLVFGQPAPHHLFACVAQITSVGPTPGVGPSIGTLLNVVILDGDRFGNAPETCGAAHMLVAPPLSEWWGRASVSPDSVSTAADHPR